jgi:hypothetical protein
MNRMTAQARLLLYSPITRPVTIRQLITGAIKGTIDSMIDGETTEKNKNNMMPCSAIKEEKTIQIMPVIQAILIYISAFLFIFRFLIIASWIFLINSENTLSLF